MLSERLSDATWTATRALRHERVAEHFARSTAVVPLRFGAIYLRRDGVERMLEGRAAQFRAVLARLEGREEWGLNVYVERARLREEVTGLSARLRGMAERADASTPGQAYLLRKKIEGLRDEEARAETRRVAREVEAALGEAADGVGAPARAQGRGDRAGRVGRAPRLPRRTRRASTRSAPPPNSSPTEYTPLGFRFELTGPWPAYNFAAVEEESQV